MTLATILALLGKHWKALAVGALVLLLSVQTARLSHAKADQWDRTACVRHQPCKAVKWKAEVLEMRPALAATKANLATCHVNMQAVGDALAVQNAAVADLKADSANRLKASAKAASDARAVAESYRRNASAILARKSGPDACKSAEDLIAEAVR